MSLSLFSRLLICAHLCSFADFCIDPHVLFTLFRLNILILALYYAKSSVAGLADFDRSLLPILCHFPNFLSLVSLRVLNLFQNFFLSHFLPLWIFLCFCFQQFFISRLLFMLLFMPLSSQSCLPFCGHYVPFV